MSWPAWPKADRTGLARYVVRDGATRVRLDIARDSVLARPDGRVRVAEAIYRALARLDLRYAREAYTGPGVASQVVRDPYDLLDGSGDATCLDLALLYAGVCLGNELLPLVVVFSDHAIAAVASDAGARDAIDRGRRGADDPRAGLRAAHAALVEQGVLTDRDAVLELLDSGAFLPVECTGIARSEGALPATLPEARDRDGDGLLAWAAATAAGRAQFEHPGREFAFAIDPAVLLDRLGFTPHAPPSIAMANVRPDIRILLDQVHDEHRVFGGRGDELAVLDSLLERPGPACCLVTGGPGTGKTALLSRWTRDVLRERSGIRVAHHFVSRQHGLAEQETMLRSLCQQLSTLAGRGAALPADLVSLRALYLELLTRTWYPQPVLVVIDGLDEADGWRADEQLVPMSTASDLVMVLSARTIAGVDWPARLRLGRFDGPGRPGWLGLELTSLSRDAVGSLLADAGAAAADLAGDPAFVDAVHGVSQGDPFYLRFLVEDMQAGRVTGVVDLVDRPAGVEDYLDKWWDELKGDAAEAQLSAVLGYLVVARGPILLEELVAIDPADDLPDVLSITPALERRVNRYLAGTERTGYALSHPRLHDHLVEHLLSPGIQDRYRQRLLAWCARWKDTGARYPLAQYAAHLLERAEQQPGEFGDALDAAVTLVTDPDYHERFMGTSDDVPGLVAQVMGVLDAVAATGGPRALAGTVATSLVAARLRATWARAELVFAAAAAGNDWAVQQRLAHLAADVQWQAVGLLLAAAAAQPREPAAATRLLAQGRDLLFEGDRSLQLLAGRVAEVVEGAPRPVLELRYRAEGLPESAPSIAEATALVDDLAGADEPDHSGIAVRRHVDPDLGLVADYDDEALAWIAEEDAPGLARLAIDEPDRGSELLERYARVHASNPYREYRNRSLFAILEAVLCVPDTALALASARTTAELALGGGTIEFVEGLELAVSAVAESSGSGPLGQPFRDRVDAALARAAELSARTFDAEDTRPSDTWGLECRRLAALAEVARIAFDDPATALQLLDAARDLPFGYAGFQVFASVARAEAEGICADGPAVARVDDAFAAARRSAHNIQDAPFCLRATAQLRGLEQAWQRPEAELPTIVERFVTQPDAAEFSPEHHVGESFDGRREGAEVMGIPEWMRRAATPSELASAFGVPVSEVLRANAAVDADGVMAGVVRVPVGSHPPLVAAQLSAHLLAAPTLPGPERVRLLQHLVAVAVPSPTCLDTVLRRLVLQARPEAEVLRGIRRELDQVVTAA